MRFIAAGLALILVLAFGSYRQTQTPFVISCGSVSGGTTAVAKGAEWAERLGTWVRNVADNPEQYRDPANIRKAVEGVLKDVLWYWLRAGYLGLKGEKPDSELERLKDQAARQTQQARTLCTPCPRVQSGAPLDSFTANSSKSGATVATQATSTSTYTSTGSPEEVARQAAARYFPADQVDTAVAVAQAESSLNPKARNNVQDGMLGLWQINLSAHRNLVGSKDWTDPSVNAWLAYQVWKAAGNSWTPWSTFTSGSYRKYLSDGAEAGTSTAKAAIVALGKANGAPTNGHADPEGLPAFDLMSQGAKRDKIAETIRTNPTAYGARYVITNMQIASPKSDWAWRPYTPIANTGDFTHVNHVHVSYTDGPVAAAGQRPAQVTGEAPGVGCQAGSMPGARIATWNSNYSLPNDARVVRGMLAIAKEADIINAQELSNPTRKRKVTDALKGVGWSASALNTSHPIYVRDAWGTITADEQQKYYTRGDDIEGLDQGDRYVNSVTVRTQTGTLTDINMHQLPHIQDGGTWNKGEPKRRAVAERGWQIMADTARKATSAGAVVVAGDMNWDGDPGAYAAAGLTMTSKVFGTVDTLRKREIDQILFTAGAPTATRQLGKFGSDHMARVVDFPGTSTPSATADPAGSVSPADFNFPGQNTVDQAMAWMEKNQGTTGWYRRCLAADSQAYGLNGTYSRNGSYYASEQWDMMPAKYKHEDGSLPPRGALVFWKTSTPAGHVAISAGGGKIWTTDPDGAKGTIGLVDISMLDAWGVRRGWSSPFFPGKTNAGGSSA